MKERFPFKSFHLSEILKRQQREWKIMIFTAFSFSPRFIQGVLIVLLGLLMLAASPLEIQARGGGFLGHQKKKGCTKCHEDQYKSWLKTPHAKAMNSLKSNNFREEKIKAKLDPGKDYRKDNNCLKCHTTGFAKGGYLPDNKRRARKFSGVGCESCHGSGRSYMQVKKKYEKDDFPRKEIQAAGLKYGEEKVCRT
ncbi:MAG: cytochrome c family protein, partial [bacterium]